MHNPLEPNMHHLDFFFSRKRILLAIPNLNQRNNTLTLAIEILFYFILFYFLQGESMKRL